MTKQTTKNLAGVLLLPTGLQEMEQLLTDLLTPQEIERIFVRWQNAKLSAEGLPREEIQKETGSSLTTISRAKGVVDHGTGVIKTLLARREQ